MLRLFCTLEIDSTPPATITGAPSTTMRCAAIEVACKPEEQKRLTVVPATVTGQPARIAATRATLCPVAPSGSPQPKTTSSTSPGEIPARSMAARMTCAAMSAPCVRFRAPRKALPIGVRALATITACLVMTSSGPTASDD